MRTTVERRASTGPRRGSASTARISVVLPVPEEPIIRMLPTRKPASCLARATAISRMASSCPRIRRERAPAMAAGSGAGGRVGSSSALDRPRLFLQVRKSEIPEIFLARLSLISECLGTDDRLFKARLNHQECRPPSRRSSQPWPCKYRGGPLGSYGDLFFFEISAGRAERFLTIQLERLLAAHAKLAEQLVAGTPPGS